MRGCSREKDLVAGKPMPEELREHVAGCAECARSMLLRDGMRALRAEGVAAARLEAPGAIWWRAQLRRRQAAMEEVARPLRAAQLFAFAVTISFAAGFGMSELRHSGEWMGWVSNGLESVSFASVLSGWNLVVGLVGVVGLAVLGGVAFYLGSDRG